MAIDTNKLQQQAADLSEDQFLLLMRGYNPLETRVREVTPEKIN